jgi:hypothetical protein
MSKDKKKLCTNCNIEKEFRYFSKDGTRNNGLNCWCKECVSKHHKEYYLLNQEKLKSYVKLPETRKRAKRKYYYYKYGITKEERDKMIANQRGLCAICGNKLGKDICVDHDHKRGNVRGILCGLCNRGLGNFKDNERSLKKAIQYLKNGGICGK